MHILLVLHKPASGKQVTVWLLLPSSTTTTTTSSYNTLLCKFGAGTRLHLCAKICSEKTEHLPEIWRMSGRG